MEATELPMERKTNGMKLNHHQNFSDIMPLYTYILFDG